MSLADKMHLVADTLRNCYDINHGHGRYYNKDNDSFCAMGALAFRAGVPKDQMDGFGLSGALELYGIDNETRYETQLKITNREADKYNISTNYKLSMLWALNDAGMPFDKIAEIVDRTADSL
jgi:hypothetical protein